MIVESTLAGWQACRFSRFKNQTNKGNESVNFRFGPVSFVLRSKAKDEHQTKGDEINTFERITLAEGRRLILNGRENRAFVIAGVKDELSTG